MADPTTPPGDSSDRRGRRRDRKRQRARRVVGIVVGVLVVAAVVLVASDLVRLSGEDKPSLANTVHATGNDDDASGPTTTTRGRSCRPLTEGDPLRLWVGGDSLAGSLGPSLGKLAGATGVVQPYFDSRVSSGLADPGFFDWPEHAATEMARLDPEVVVFIIGANDWTAVSGEWKGDYTAKVDEMMKTLDGGGRTVYWLGSPTLKDEKMDAAVVQVNAAAQEVAKRHPNVHYVDTYKLFSDTDGTFAYDLPDETGTEITMRAGDGVHFTMDGGDYLARQVYKLVDAQCAITEQKVDGATKQTIESEGSTQVAPNVTSGSGNSSGSSGYYGNGTIQTTPPATAASTTSPPVQTAPPATDPPATTTPPVTTSPVTTTP
jgi:lysophospholipase L1-like esterase